MCRLVGHRTDIFYFSAPTAAMVDMDKHACHQLAENGYKNGQWPETYITWEFLTDHPRAMESGYFHVDWNSIPGSITGNPI